MKSIGPKRLSPKGCLVVLICISLFLAFTTYPSMGFWLGTAFAVVSLLSLLLRDNWFIPLTIAGTYFGLFVLNPAVKGGTIQSQMYETLYCTLAGTIAGFTIGALIDLASYSHDDERAADGTEEPRELKS